LNEKEYQRRVEATTRIVLRPLATPVPLAFFAFGIGSFLLSGQQLGLVSQGESRNVAIVLAAFVFPAELLAAVFAFLGRETLGGTVLGLFSFAWLSTALVNLNVEPGATSGALGLLELSLAVILVFIGAAAFLGKPVLAAVIVLASIRFGLNGVYDLATISAVQTASGFLGLLIALLSLYGGLAFGIEDLLHRTILPIGRRGEARQAFEQDLGEQVGPVENEAGVRKQL
jgi:succinate-acetate transporter protein